MAPHFPHPEERALAMAACEQQGQEPAQMLLLPEGCLLDVLQACGEDER